MPTGSNVPELGRTHNTMGTGASADILRGLATGVDQSRINVLRGQSVQLRPNGAVVSRRPNIDTGLSF
ncbi:MAG TPA: hypothetical protein PKB15_08575 [Acidimicrobiia bacterium]|nr:hypothetical protein [Acidimicrobiia bacterium]